MCRAHRESQLATTYQSSIIINSRSKESLGFHEAALFGALNLFRLFADAKSLIGTVLFFKKKEENLLTFITLSNQ